jgi:predicted RNase H-like HicB family nuclease
MNRNYKITINWSNAGNAFIADVPELSGCVADGKSFMEALENVEMVIEEWIASAMHAGIPIPQPKQNFLTRVS